MNTATLKSSNSQIPNPANHLFGKSNNVATPFFKPPIQPKLSINTPGDAYEQEADTMADKVMRMKSPQQTDAFLNLPSHRYNVNVPLMKRRVMFTVKKILIQKRMEVMN